MKNDKFLYFLLLSISDDCSKFKSETDCLNMASLAGCVWFTPKKECIKPVSNIPKSSIVEAECPGMYDF